MNVLQNTYQLKGSKNSIGLTATYTKRFTCNFLLEDYPFDTQICTAEFKLSRNAFDFVDLQVGALYYSAQHYLKEYEVVGSGYARVTNKDNMVNIF